MAFLQGSTYELPIQIKDPTGKIITPEDVTKVQFVFDSIEKFYSEDGDVTFDSETQSFIVPLTEDETFAMNGSIKWQIRVLYVSGAIDGSKAKIENVYQSITRTKLTPQEEQPEETPQQEEA